MPDHLVTADVAEYPAELQPWSAALRGRSMLCRRLAMQPVECVARGYLTGSGLADYRATGSVCGVPLPDGLVDGSALPRAGLHAGDQGRGRRARRERLLRGGRRARSALELAEELRRLTLAVYGRGAALAARRGILLADTKLEFGLDAAGVLTLGDEVLTPDSSRFWPAATYEPGRPQPSYDKQYVRDWLDASGWDRTAPGPELPDEVVEQTRGRYVEAYERLTGSSFDSYLREA